MSQSDARADLEVLAIDGLEGRVQTDQLGTHDRSAFIGWFLLVLLAVDLIGNIAGAPLVTGHLLAFGERVRQRPVSSDAWTQVGVVIAPLVQIVFALVAFRVCLHQSYWRLWFRSAPSGGGRLRAVARQIRSDYASLLGVSLGVLFALLCLLLKWQNGWESEYGAAVREGRLVPFQLMELALALFVPVVGPFLAATNYSDARRVLLAAPASWLTACYQFDFAGRPVWPLEGLLQHPSLREQKVLTLVEAGDDTYAPVGFAERLPLTERRTVFLGLAQLGQRIGSGVSEYRDLGDFFTLRATFEVTPRTLEEVGEDAWRRLGHPLPGRFVGAILGDLFNHPNPRALLNRLNQEAFNRFLADLFEGVGDARGFQDLLRCRRTALNEASLVAPGAQLAAPEVGAGDRLVLGTGVDPFQRLRASLAQLKPFQKDYLDRWGRFRAKRISAAGELPRLFAELLREHFVGAGAPARALAWDAFRQCCEITLLVIDFQFQPGVSQQIDRELERLDQEYEQEKRRCENWYQTHEAEVTAFLRQLQRDRVANQAVFLRDFLRQAPDFAMMLNHCPDLLHKLDGLAGQGLFGHALGALKGGAPVPALPAKGEFGA